jgi:hypothetical protein
MRLAAAARHKRSWNMEKNYRVIFNSAGYLPVENHLLAGCSITD